MKLGVCGVFPANCAVSCNLHVFFLWSHRKHSYLFCKWLLELVDLQWCDEGDVIKTIVRRLLLLQLIRQIAAYLHHRCSAAWKCLNGSWNQGQAASAQADSDCVSSNQMWQQCSLWILLGYKKSEEWSFFLLALATRVFNSSHFDMKK